MTAAALDHGPDRLLTRLRGALGERVLTALKAPDTLEIMINPDGRLWIETHTGMIDTGEVFTPERRMIIIALCADAEGVAPTWELSADLPETGDRFHAMLPPAVTAPSITIRKHAENIIPLAAWVRDERISPARARLLMAAVKARIGIVMAGATGSGKTTLLNTLAQRIAPAERVITIEDRRELSLPNVPNKVQMLSLRGAATTHDLAVATLRMRPDRILIGEARDGATLLEGLKIAETGHGGLMLTTHADSARGALTRLERLIREVSHDPMRDLIAGTIGLVAFLRGRKLVQLLRVRGCTGERYVTASW